MPSPRLAAHSRNQPKLPHSATQKKGGIRQQSRNVLCWILADPHSDREHFTQFEEILYIQRVPQPPEEGGEEEELKSRKQTSILQFLLLTPSTHQTIHESKVLLLHPVCGLPDLPSCWTLREYLYDLPWTSNLGVILLQLGPLMSYIADGDVYPRRQLQMVMRDSGDSH